MTKYEVIKKNHIERKNVSTLHENANMIQKWYNSGVITEAERKELREYNREIFREVSRAW